MIRRVVAAAVVLMSIGVLPAASAAACGGKTIEGTSKDDTLHGTCGPDVIYGGGGSDTILGFDGRDRIFGGGGEDFLVGDAGADHLDGGPSRDWIVYFESPTGVTVDLASGEASRGDAVGDSFTSVENIIGSRRADVLSGNNAANRIKGNGGRDQLVGRGGADDITADGGRDTVAGLGGADRLVLSGPDVLTYAASPAGVNVDFVDGVFSGGHAEGDFVYGGAYVMGSAHDDSFVGSSTGTARTFVGGAGADTFGGHGVVDYATSGAGVLVDVSDGAAESGGDAEGDVIDMRRSPDGRYGFAIVGSAYADQLTGSSARDALFGRDGDDVLDGADGDDFLQPMAGADAVIGGGSAAITAGETWTGGDVVSFVSATTGVTVDLSTGVATGEGGDQLSGVETVAASNHDDVLQGDEGANLLSGGYGADQVSGGGGNDGLDAGAYDAVDSLDGGAHTADPWPWTGTGADPGYSGDICWAESSVDATASCETQIPAWQAPFHVWSSSYRLLSP